MKPEPRRRQRYPLERPHAGAGPDRAPHRPRRDRFVPPARRPISASQTPPTLSGPLRAQRPTGFGRSYFRRESPSLSTPVDKPSSHVWTLESALSTRVNRRGGTASRHFEGMGVSAVGVSRGRAQACRQAASVGEFAARQTTLGKAPLARSRKPRCRTQLTRGGAPVDSSRPTATCAADRRGSAPTCSRRRSRRRPSGR